MQRTKAEKKPLHADTARGGVGRGGKGSEGGKVGKVPAEKDEKCCGKVDASMHCHAIIMKFECSACGSVANIAIAMLQLQLPQPATQWQQQLQWQLAQFQLLLLGASSVVVFSVLFLPPAACSAVFSFVCCCCLCRRRCRCPCHQWCYLSPAPCATTTSYNYVVSSCLGQNWPCGPRRCFLAQLGKYFKQSK